MAEQDLTQSHGLFCLLYFDIVKENTGGAREIREDTQLDQATQNDQGNIPDNVTSCSVYKVRRGRMKKRGIFGVTVQYFDFLSP